MGMVVDILWYSILCYYFVFVFLMCCSYLHSVFFSFTCYFVFASLLFYILISYHMIKFIEESFSELIL